MNYFFDENQFQYKTDIKLIKIFFLLFIIFVFFVNFKYNLKDNILNNYPYFIKCNFCKNINVLDNNDLLLINKNTKIENILILIQIIPFLKNNLFLNLQNNKNLFIFLKNIFFEKIVGKFKIKINKNDIYYIINHFNEILNYRWEIFPKIEIINSVRYIINNYYNEFCLDIFDKILNLNLEHYLQNKKDILSYKDIKILISKFFCIYLLIANIGSYQKEKCIGRGTSGRVIK